MISGYVKAVFICISVASTTPSFTSGDNVTGKCFPLTSNQTNAIDEETSAEYDVVHTVFFLPSDLTEEGLSHGDLILDASMNSTPSDE